MKHTVYNYVYHYTCDICETSQTTSDNNLPRGWTECDKKHICSNHEVFEILHTPAYIIRDKGNTANWRLLDCVEPNLNTIKETQSIPDNFVLIPSGHLNKTKINEFYMCKYCVTEEEYRNDIGNKKPAVNISYEDAILYCDKLTKETGLKYRLPTETEWEYACRAGTTTDFNTGNTLEEWQANFDSKGVVNVGSYTPNDWGLYDMHGNVWEWTSTMEGSDRVLRGGSWFNYAQNCRSAYRYFNGPSDRYTDIGIRLLIDK